MANYWIWIYLQGGNYHKGLRSFDGELQSATDYFTMLATKHYKEVREVKVFETSDIPVSFEVNGKNYKGHFSKPHGPHVDSWFLMIDNYYCGNLLFQQGKWAFYGPESRKEFSTLADYFGQCVTSKKAPGKGP